MLLIHVCYSDCGMRGRGMTPSQWDPFHRAKKTTGWPRWWHHNHSNNHSNDHSIPCDAMLKNWYVALRKYIIESICYLPSYLLRYQTNSSHLVPSLSPYSNLWTIRSLQLPISLTSPSISIIFISLFLPPCFVSIFVSIFLCLPLSFSLSHTHTLLPLYHLSHLCPSFVSTSVSSGAVASVFVQHIRICWLRWSR